MDDDDLATGPANPDTDEFSKAFAQRSEERRQGKPAPVEQEPATTEAADGDDTDGSADSAAGADADAAAKKVDKQAPAPKADGEKPHPVAGKTGKTVEELEDELAKALHRERSVANRISANDRRVNELTTENAALKRKVAELETASKAGKTAAAPAQGKSLDDVLANAPDLEAAVQRRIEAAQAQVRQELDAANARLQELGESTAKTADAVRPVVERDAEAAVARVQSDLDTMFTPQWRKDRSSADFQLWLNNQSRSIQDLYANSVDAKDCAAVLDLYYGPRGGRPKPAAAPNPNASNGTKQPAPQGAAERLKQAAGIPAKQGVVAAKPDPNDFDSAFAEATAARRNRKD